MEARQQRVQCHGASAYDIQHDDELIGEDWLDSYLTSTILDAKYEKVDIHDVATNQKHLTPDQQHELECVLAKYTGLFDGTVQGCTLIRSLELK